MTVFVVLMRRWGSEEGHNYLEGVYLTKEEAEQAGQHESIWRGGKYDAAIFEVAVGTSSLPYAAKREESEQVR